MKNSTLLTISIIGHGRHESLSSSIVWNLDSTHKLIKCKNVASGMIGSHSRIRIWIKKFNHKPQLAAHQVFQISISEYAALLRVYHRK